MFTLTVNKQNVLNPLLTVAGAVDKKQSHPVLANILLTVNNNVLCLTGTDLEIEITAHVQCNHEGSGITTVPAKKMFDIIRSLEDDAQITIAYKDNVVTIKQGRSQFKLATLSPDNYPNTEEEQSDWELSLLRSDLIQILHATQFAMSVQDVRVFLNGVLLEIDGQCITAVASDGHRMAVYRLPSPSVVSTPYRLLLPRKGVQEMVRLLNNIVDEHVTIYTSKNHFKLFSSQYTFLSKLIEARYPPFIKAIPRDQDKLVIVDRDLLKRALSRIIILANEKSRAMILELESDQLTLIANNQEQEQAIETLFATVLGEPLKIAINASYLLDVLNHLPEGVAHLSFTTAEGSILVESPHDPHYQYIIMPMTI